MTPRLPPSCLKPLRQAGLSVAAGMALTVAIATPSTYTPASAEEAAQTGQPITLLSDIQEANANTGVVTARGNVQIFYPAQNMQATAIQAQYYSREGRIVLSGDVFVLQDGNSIQGETITYLVDQGRFVAMPEEGGQVQSVYLLPGADSTSGTVTVPESTFNPKPEFKDPMSTP